MSPPSTWETEARPEPWCPAETPPGCLTCMPSICVRIRVTARAQCQSGWRGHDLRGCVTCREGEVGEGGCPPSLRFWGFTFWLLGLVPVALSTRANGGAGVLLALGRVRCEAPPAESHRDAPSAGEAVGPGLHGKNPETELTPPGCRQGLGGRTPPIPPRLWPPGPLLSSPGTPPIPASRPAAEGTSLQGVPLVPALCTPAGSVSRARAGTWREASGQCCSGTGRRPQDRA